VSASQQILAALAGLALLLAIALNSLLPALPALLLFAYLAVPRSSEALPCDCLHCSGAGWDPLDPPS
jgi:hypothetical protein